MSKVAFCVSETSKPLSDPQILQVPTRRWGSISTDFIVQLPKTEKGYDCITRWVDRFSHRVHFIPSRVTDTAIEAAERFFQHDISPPWITR